MKRREFSQVAVGSVAAAAAGWGGASFAQGLREGADYLEVKPRAPVEAAVGKIEVVEFFWYSCPHCNAFEPLLKTWAAKAPADVVLRRVPVAFRDDFVPQQRLYFALEAMRLVDKLHSKVFAAIHDEKQTLARSDAIAQWVAKQGVDMAKFTEHYNSFAVATKASRSAQLQNAYKVEGVPALGVDGRFYTDGSLAGNVGRSLQVVDGLLRMVRTAK
ncbi:thiol:disulfide interchange protein DsbA/DsbL [Rhodoferax sp.]|jgi:thiol:disulfide interchange protein DsbA|uniref:thiol:disulfide interchange protein DsbA/DsbL n=1 Tax=Rhodoferax sp. TaxID=50421 RepID=UPI00378497C5